MEYQIDSGVHGSIRFKAARLARGTSIFIGRERRCSRRRRRGCESTMAFVRVHIRRGVDALCVNAESNAVQRGRSNATLRQLCYVEYANRTRGHVAPDRESERERKRDATGRSCRTAESTRSESLCAPPWSPPRLPRNCISRIIGVSLPISGLAGRSLQNSRSLRETSDGSSSGRVEFLWLPLALRAIRQGADRAILSRPFPSRKEFSRLCFRWRSIGKPRAKANGEEGTEKTRAWTFPKSSSW